MTITVPLDWFYFCLGVFATLLSQFVFLVFLVWNYGRQRPT